MKSYDEIVKRILDYINKAVHSSDENVTDYILESAKALGWVIGLEEEDIQIVFDGEMTKEFVIIRGQEGGVAGV